MLWLSIGLGLVISLIFAEAFGLAAGGLVVPGYVALYLDNPSHIAGTLLCAFAALFTLKLISNYSLVYGRRRLVLVILLGFIYGFLLRYFLQQGIVTGFWRFDPIGFIIPGLLAFWMEKQGILETITTLVIASTLVRLLLIIINGGNLLELPYI
ncbi:poly-gamma-glutamate biosynthesis protein PgsC [bacterium]|nr:poly-gamma-glutamate biosynthesis protein PgsC [bacterium]